MSQSLINSLQSVFLGTLLTAASDVQPYLLDWRRRKQGSAFAVAQPTTTEEVAQIVQWCVQHGVAIVPQGGNTGLSGGATPEPAHLASHPALLLSLKKLNRIRDLDTTNNTMIVEAGCILQTVQAAAKQAGRLFALSLAAQGTCTVGGNLATNAGGVHVLRYGNARDLCLGLEVVTAQGEIWQGLRGLRKDNTGYDLRDLFIGAEGTLGIITAATLKLHPLPVARQVAWLGVDTPQTALALLNLAQQRLGDSLTAFELISELAHGMVLKNISGARRPLTEVFPWYILLERIDLHSHAACNTALQAFLEEAVQIGLIKDAIVSVSQAQFQALWALREHISEAQAVEGKNIKHDISVPVSQIPAFLRVTRQRLERAFPKVRLVTFGHVGDGNLHYNIAPPIGQSHESFLMAQESINRIVHDSVMQFQGSISAEHGLGTLRRDEAARYKSPVEMRLMRAIKQAFDPNNLMNPGKVLSI